MEEGRLIVLSGPTASGKTRVALALSRLFPLEIVNADSVQVYRGMDIGSAKPTPAERREVPHHLLDVADPDEAYNAGRFVREAEEAIEGILGRGRVPLVAGGTGMYIRALLKGLDPLPSDPGVRALLLRRWEEEGPDVLFGELRDVDPVTAAKVHPSDRVRVIRALEVARITGEPPSVRKVAWKTGPDGREGNRGWRRRVLFLALSPDREEIRRRIDLRVDAMIREGLVREVAGLLAKGYGAGHKSMGSLGYRHVAAHLVDGVPLDRAVSEMKRDTRRYAKRQMTWLSRESEARRLEGETAAEAASELTRKFLL